jgi:hypothetical protein
METKYYLPIKSECLAHYFGTACIMPSKYFFNKPIDIQDKFEEFLLITKSLGTKETDCCLELVFTKTELYELIDIKEGFFLYQKPLPISRVRSVIFSDKNQKEQTIVNITMSTAFVPEKLIQLISKFDSKDTSKLKKPDNIQITDWSLSIKKYNSLLGGFALLRLSGEDYMNYSENYFSSLAVFNLTIESELLNSGKSFKNLFNDNLYKQIQPLLQKNIDDSDLDEVAKKENQIIKKDYLKNIDLNALNNATYVIAVLKNFGVGEESKKKKIDGLILSNFKADIKNDKSELIALCYGLNRGYSVFSNKYKSGNNEKKLKFELNSQLDYYTIESLFQYSFNEPKSEAFPYIDSWCPTLKKYNIIKRKSDYQVLDVLVTGKKKPKVFSQEYLANLLQRFFQKETEGLFKDIFEKIRTIIYNDTIEELNDEITLRDEEIKRLKNEESKVSKLEIEIGRLMNEKQANTIKNKELVVNYRQSYTNKTIVEEPIITHLNLDKKTIVKQVLNYKEKNKIMLEKEAKEKGIIIPKGAKLDDIIILLMTVQNNLPDSKLQFPE